METEGTSAHASDMDDSTSGLTLELVEPTETEDPYSMSSDIGVVEEVYDTSASVTANASDANMSVTLDFKIESETPQKNMQPFRETLSEFEMFAKAGELNSMSSFCQVKPVSFTVVTNHFKPKTNSQIYDTNVPKALINMSDKGGGE